MLFFKLGTWLLLGVMVFAGTGWYLGTQSNIDESDLYRQQLDDNTAVAAHRQIAASHVSRSLVQAGAWVLWVATGIGFFYGEVGRLVKRKTGKPAISALWLATFALFACEGCVRPFEPVQLETIATNEEGFLIPLRDDARKQAQTTSTEDYLKQHLVYTKQVQIKQQWVPKGYELLWYNGVWQPAEVLIRVNKSPITREWTADPNSGTSTRNEAVWVMTADQVEFSTGWTITARISSRDEAVKFLHNYPNGSLKEVLDTEVRGKLQAIFGLEVTDLPMDELRKHATPHIQSTVSSVTTFFAERGISITNLGITGGFVYKDRSVLDTMVKVFNAEQERSIAAAATGAQDEKNKKIRMEAEGKAQALLLEKHAEADGIKLVADAKAYEIQQAKQDLRTYIELKRLEIERDKLKTWDGHFPQFFMGTGSSNSPDLLLNVPLTAERFSFPPAAEKKE